MLVFVLAGITTLMACSGDAPGPHPALPIDSGRVAGATSAWSRCFSAFQAKMGARGHGGG